ncbi:MAG TPA: hypothetical protein VGD56_18860, partial [Gemmatirosa sp.]
ARRPAPAAPDGAGRDAEAAVQAFVAKFDAARQQLIVDLRAALRRRYPAAHELVWDNYNFVVLGYSPTPRPPPMPHSRSRRPHAA